MFSMAPEATILPLAFEFRATPPARQRFFDFVFSRASITTDIMAASQASCTAKAIFLWWSEISDSGSRGAPKSGVKWEYWVPSPISFLVWTRYGLSFGFMNGLRPIPGWPYGARPITFHSSLLGTNPRNPVN